MFDDKEIIFQDEHEFSLRAKRVKRFSSRKPNQFNEMAS